MNILDKILLHKKEEILIRKSKNPLSKFRDQVLFPRKTISMVNSLQSKQQPHIIAEFKRHSPSKGDINLGADILAVSQGYEKEGASGLSILTESAFFKGSDDDFIAARSSSKLPLLRKDFMIDEYQFYEAKAIGADVVLLIASILSRNQVLEYLELSHSLSMEVILEIHHEKELDKCWVEGIDMVGVNNRDLTNFKVDIETSLMLAHKIPRSSLKISESGISNPETIIRLMEMGYEGFLIGETFMKEKDPSLALQKFIASFNFSKK